MWVLQVLQVQMAKVPVAGVLEWVLESAQRGRTAKESVRESVWQGRTARVPVMAWALQVPQMEKGSV